MSKSSGKTDTSVNKRSKGNKYYENKQTSQVTWVVTIVIALIVSYLLFEPYIAVILLALLAAVLFNGVYHGLLKRLKGSRAKAALAVTVYSVLVFGIPIIVIIALATEQALNFIDSLKLGEITAGDFSLDEVVNSIVDGTNNAASSIVGKDNIVNESQVSGFITNTLPDVLSGFLGLLKGIIASIPGFFMNMIIYFFVFTGLLINQENIAKYLRHISPFSKDLNDKYVSRAIAMAKAMLKGQLLIAFLQGLAGALSLAIVGFGDYFVFFLLIFTLLCMIPLGSGIILIPLGIIMIPFGMVWQGLFILGVHFVITTNIDNVIRPMVVPKDAWLPASLTILSALGGVYLFGLPGVIYGPILSVVIMTTFEAYADMKEKKALESAKA